MVPLAEPVRGESPLTDGNAEHRQRCRERLEFGASLGQQCLGLPEFRLREHDRIPDLLLIPNSIRYAGHWSMVRGCFSYLEGECADLTRSYRAPDAENQPADGSVSRFTL